MAEVILFGEPLTLFASEHVSDLQHAELFRKFLAGAEVNVSIGLTRLGHPVSYVTKLGNDPFGHFIADKLAKEGIGTQNATFDDAHLTGFQIKSRVENGDPDIFYFRKNSAASTLSPEDIDQVDFAGVRHVHLTGIAPALSDSCRAAAQRLIARARENGATVSFDPNLRPSLWKDEATMVRTLNAFAAQSDIVLPGIGEGKILTGFEDPAQIAAFYRSAGAKCVIIKMGGQGAYVSEGTRAFTVPGFKVEKIVDTVGAGDGFSVGVISARLEGKSFEEAVRRGNAIGAMQIAVQGDNEGLPTPAQLEAFYAAHQGQ